MPPPCSKFLRASASDCYALLVHDHINVNGKTPTGASVAATPAAASMKVALADMRIESFILKRECCRLGFVEGWYMS